MATTENISSNQYVAITSVVGGASAVTGRELKGRLVTTNDLIPTGSVLEFDSASSVLSYFGGSTATEYLQAAQYFAHIDKAGRSPTGIQFARWADTDTSAQVFGAESATLTQLKTYTAGAFDVTLDGSTFSVTALDFSAATALADIATALEAKIQAADASLSSTTVAYNSTRKGFDIDTLGTADGALSFTEVTASLLDDLGLNSLAIYSDGVAEQTLTEMATTSTNINNNYGSFATVDQLTLAETVELATWNAAQNVMFQYYPRCTIAEAATWSPDLIGYSGCGLTAYSASNAGQYPWLHPMSELASVVWTEPAAIKNFMYTQDSTQTAVIFNDTAKANADAQRLNYFGRTQESGTELTFYQKGVLMGGTNAPLQMGVYAGEQWLKSELKAQFLNMFLALPIVSADEIGQSIASTYVNSAAETALANGVFFTGATFSTTTKNYITQITGDSNAWQAVQRDGYWFTTAVVDGDPDFTITYTLIYAKRDGVSKVEGRHILV